MAQTGKVALSVSIATLLLNSITLGGFFEDDLDYLSRAFPEDSSEYCPNIPYYGGYTGIAGNHARACITENVEIFESDQLQITEISDFRETKPYYAPIQEDIKHPVILVWTSRSNNKDGYIKQCPKSTCLVTENRNWLNHTQTKVVYFYATMFLLKDLPLPRPEGQLWALFHEESPKNNPMFSYASLLELFNISSTFRDQSHYSLMTQYLRSLEQLMDTRYVKTVQDKRRYQLEEGLAPIIYVQSDCDVPSDRDRLVQWLSRYIKINSYGQCLNNKSLPSHLLDPANTMGHHDFLELVSKYKFALAMENAVCDNYITEKLWRPFIVGTVPIIHGAPNAKEWVPTNHSGIHLQDFTSIQKLAEFIIMLDNNDTAYEEFRSFKKTGIDNEKLKKTMLERPWDTDYDSAGINRNNRKGNFLDNFDCFICDAISEKDASSERGKFSLQVTKDHYGCPLPLEYTDSNNLTLQKPFSQFWDSIWKSAYCDVQAMLELSEGGKKWFPATSLQEKSTVCQRNVFEKSDFY